MLLLLSLLRVLLLLLLLLLPPNHPNRFTVLRKRLRPFVLPVLSLELGAEMVDELLVTDKPLLLLLLMLLVVLLLLLGSVLLSTETVWLGGNDCTGEDSDSDDEDDDVDAAARVEADILGAVAEGGVDDADAGAGSDDGDDAGRECRGSDGDEM